MRRVAKRGGCSGRYAWGAYSDLVKSNALRLNGVEFLVLDEADRMLDMGFIHDIRRIVAKLPAILKRLYPVPAVIESGVNYSKAFHLRSDGKLVPVSYDDGILRLEPD